MSQDVAAFKTCNSRIDGGWIQNKNKTLFGSRNLIHEVIEAEFKFRGAQEGTEAKVNKLFESRRSPCHVSRRGRIQESECKKLLRLNSKWTSRRYSRRSRCWIQLFESRRSQCHVSRRGRIQEIEFKELSGLNSKRTSRRHSIQEMYVEKL